MNSIMSLITDPRWWFTTCFMGIIISVLGSYFRDGISSVVGRVSLTVRVYRQKRVEKEKTRIDVLIMHQDILIMEMLRVLLGLMVHVGAMVAFITLPAFFDFVNRTLEKKYTLVNFKMPVEFISNLIILQFGAIAMYSAFKVIPRLEIVMTARQKYEQKKLTPPNPTSSDTPSSPRR